MAGVQRPSFLKRQKEQKRLAKAAAKREKRDQNRLAKANPTQGAEPEVFETEPADGTPGTDAAE